MTNQKLFSIFGIFTVLLFSMALVSAAVTFTTSPSSTVIEFFQTGSETITLTPANNESVKNYSLSLALSPSITEDLGDSSISLSNYSIISSIANNNIANTSVNVALSATIADASALSFNKIYNGTVTIRANDDSSNNRTIKFKILKSYCDSGESTDGDLKITSIEDKSSGDAFEWAPLKDIELVVTVDNNNGKDAKRATIEVGLFDVEKGKLVDISAEDKELKDSQRIDSDESSEFAFNFQLPADLEEDKEYWLFAKVYESSEESTTCLSVNDDTDSYYEAITIVYDDEILIGEIVAPSSLICGASDSVSFNLYNLDVGDEEQFRINLYNQELGVNSYSESFELDTSDSESLTLPIAIPADAKEKEYKISIFVEYGYKESSGVYGEENRANSFQLKISGNCQSTQPVVAASSQSTAQVGKELVVKVTVTNPTSNTANYIVAAANYGTWATLVSPEGSQNVSVGAGQSKDLEIIFEPTKAGVQTFDVNVIANGQTTKQPVQVTISEGSGSLFGNMFSGTSSSTVYIIAGILLLLIIIVIVLIVKASKGKNDFEEDDE